ncbi:MAG TPA: hypothetical protein DFH97_07465 [Clostridiales bacterium]|nr:hypothetical protein [Clostridiales bacterium]
MKNRSLFIAWAFVFILCAVLGFIPAAGAAVRILLTAVSLLFFLPPALILRRGSREERQLVRTLSALSLVLTLVLIIANFLTAFRSEALGNALHALLTVVGCPMITSGHWALSLFLWACLLMASLKNRAD